MRTEPAVTRWFLPRLAAVFLGSVLLVSGCSEFGGGRDPDPVVDEGGSEPAHAELSEEEPTSGGLLDPPEGGSHAGERQQLEVEIAFSREYGETVTDEDGIHYHVGDWVFDEDKVYPSEYWGTYPLYFFDTEVGVTVAVRNNGPRAKARLIIRTEAYVLCTDGTSGVALMEPREVEVEVASGRTETIDASFTVEYAAGVESGLNRFVVKILHPSERGGDPALIMMEEGVFCPPEYQPDGGNEAF